MQFTFNDYDLIEKPKIKLCKLELLPLGFLNPTNIVIKPTFCALTELTFTVYEGTNLYDCVRKEMVLEVDGFGRFAITDVSEESDGQTTTKSVTANSYEITMNKVTLTYEDNIVFKLWDETHPESCSPHHDKMYPSLLWIIQQQTGWTIRHVDASLINHSRTMSIDKEQAYGYLMGDISDTYKCYFEFDTVNKEIYCYDRDERQHAVPNTGINLSYRNVINTQKSSESTEDVITALTVKGAEGVGINLVNPIGNDVIYNFSYYMNNEKWGMPKSLQVAVLIWQTKISNASDVYSEYVGTKRQYAEDKTKLEGDLSVAESNLKAALDVQSVLIAADASDDELQRAKKNVEEKQAEVDRIKNQIAELDKKIEDNKQEGETIVGDLSMKNNFTPAQLETLSYYINGAVYENSNFVFTDNMPDEKKIEVSQALYQQGLITMSKLSAALYEYECDTAPFMFNKKYDTFSKSIKLGDAVNLELKDGVWIQPRILQVVIDYDNPENTKVILSDSFRLNGSVYQFSDDWTKTVKASRKAYSSAPTWDEIIDPSFYSNVRDYMTNALDLTNQEIINSSNQEFTIGSYGLRGKKYDPETGTYDPCQIAITNNVIAFTNDNWASTKTALGKVKLGEPGQEREYYGLVAEAIFGNIIAGEHLTIEAKNGQLVMDSSGCRLTNATFTVTNGNTEIKISPEDGFKIRKKDGSIWTDVLSEDTNGNIIARSITLESGNIGGWTITKDGLTSPTGDYIGSNGKGKISLMTYNNTQATFDGNIYAHNLNWRYGDTDYSMFTGLFDPAGTLLGIDMLGGIGDAPVRFGGEYYSGNEGDFVRMYSKLADVDDKIKNVRTLFIEANGNIVIDSKNGGLVIASDNDHDPYGLTTTKLTVSQKATFSSEAEFFNNLKARDITTEKELVVGGAATFNDTVTFNKGITFAETGINMRDLRLSNWLVVGGDDTKDNETTSFNTRVDFNGTNNFFYGNVWFKDSHTVEFDNGFNSKGTANFDTIKFNNIESNNAYNQVGVKCGINFMSDVMVNGQYGSTREVTIDGQTLRFVNGILV